MASLPCWFCGTTQAVTDAGSGCTRCGMRPRAATPPRHAYRKLAGWILGA